jgi:hypothetical protein
MYTLDEPTVKELEVIIQELPLKYGLPILNILQTKLIKQELPVEKIKSDKK